MDIVFNCIHPSPVLPIQTQVLNGSKELSSGNQWAEKYDTNLLTLEIIQVASITNSFNNQILIIFTKE